MANPVAKNRLLSISVSCVFTAVLAFVGLGVTSQEVHAQQDKKQSQASRKTKKVQTVTQKNAKKFEKISELFDQEQDAEAKKLLDELAAIPTLNNFEKAYVARFLGIYYFDRDQLDAALVQFKKIVADPTGIPNGFYTQAFYIIAQVYFSKSDYRNALDYAQRWFKTTEDPPADAYMLLGQAYYALKQYDNALPNVKKGIQKYIDVGSVPKEGWLNLLSGIYREKNDYRNMLPVIKQLVKHYPKKVYLNSLAGIYNELNQQNKMTAIYQAMYDSNMLTKESELVTLASLLMSEDSAYKASLVLEKGLNDGTLKKEIKNYRLYSQALLISRDYDKAVKPLSQAAKLSKDGELYAQLGRSYVSLNRWGDAEKAFANAFKKGKLKRPGTAYINLGSAQFESKKFKAAKASFKKARNYKYSARDANAWIKYIDSEIKRLDALKAPVVLNVGA